MFKSTTVIPQTALTLALALGSTTASAADFMTSNYRAYELSMECHNPNIQNTGSKSALNVTFYTNTGKTYAGRKLMQPAGTCSQGQKVAYRGPQIALPNTEKLTKITVQATGGDALWAKVAHVIQYDKGAPNTGFTTPYMGRWESGHGRGYCLSTDRTDNRDTWTPYVASSTCSPKVTFKVNGPAQTH